GGVTVQWMAKRGCGSWITERLIMLRLAHPVSSALRMSYAMMLWMEHPNAALYRRTADAFREGDRVALAALIDEDVVWHIPGSAPMAGDIHGREALFRFFDRLRDVTEGTFTLEEHDVLGTDDHVVALSHMSAVREGIPVSVNVVSVFHFRDGRQQERWFHSSDMAAWDRLLGGPI
ncbi:MAG TPA: nuclear transport factor 2 family protein, partial [Actinomycetota bacterium]|nr:nuclear transport factor 2 family protein [Actinomycetota bacterium]